MYTWLVADDIGEIKTARTLGGTRLTIVSTSREHALGVYPDSDIKPLKNQIDELRQAGMAPNVRRELEPLIQEFASRDRAREAIQTFGIPLQDDEWDALERHAGPAEMPWLIISSEGNAGILAAYDNRLVIARINASERRPHSNDIAQSLALISASISAILREFIVTTFAFDQITGIEYTGGIVTGHLRVLTASHQNPARTKITDWSAAANVLPLAKSTYEQAVPAIHDLQTRVMNARTPESQRSAAQQVATIASELQKLGELHASGLIDDDEFRAAKRVVISQFST